LEKVDNGKVTPQVLADAFDGVRTQEDVDASAKLLGDVIAPMTDAEALAFTRKVAGLDKKGQGIDALPEADGSIFIAIPSEFQVPIPAPELEKK
jgi:hypothetical protein